jgi:hypothetical protein
MKPRPLFSVASFLLLALVFGYTQPAGASSPSLAGPYRLAQPANLACDVEAANGLPRFARLMHDPQWMPWPSRMGDPEWPNGFYFDWYPETVPLSATPRGTKASIRYTVDWLEYLRDLQPNDVAAVWIARIAAGLFNNQGNEFIPILDLDQLTQEPVAAGISSGGNLVKVLEIRNGSVRIETLYIKTSPPDPNEINYHTTPWLITKFTSVSVTGDLGNAGGINVYFPNLSTLEGGYWVSLERVELFPLLPLCAAAINDVPVLNTAKGLAKQVGTLSAGQTVIVHEYLAQGSNVWGQTDQGWILLEYLNSYGRPVYPTSWDMDTRPPILFP